MADHPANPLAPYLELLPKLANTVVGFTLLCYAGGFAISNMYLGSFGVVKLDILQARYVLAGLLFMLFTGAIAWLIYGLLRTLRAGAGLSNGALLRSVLWYSLQNLSVLIVVISAVAVLAGSRNLLPVGFPAATPGPGAGSAAGLAPRGLLVGSLAPAGIAFLGFVLAGFIALRRDGPLKALQILIILIAVAYIVLLVADYLTAAGQGGGTQLAIGGDDWRRYWAGIAFVYVLAAVFLTVNALLRKKGGDEQAPSFGDRLPALSPAVWLAAAAVAIIVIMPLYASRIYPALPQQVGGGQLISVEAIITDEAARSAALDSADEIYLIDRTGNATLALLVERDPIRYQVVEIANLSIKSIIYMTAP